MGLPKSSNGTVFASSILPGTSGCVRRPRGPGGARCCYHVSSPTVLVRARMPAAWSSRCRAAGMFRFDARHDISEHTDATAPCARLRPTDDERTEISKKISWILRHGAKKAPPGRLRNFRSLLHSQRCFLPSSRSFNGSHADKAAAVQSWHFVMAPDRASLLQLSNLQPHIVFHGRAAFPPRGCPLAAPEPTAGNAGGITSATDRRVRRR